MATIAPIKNVKLVPKPLEFVPIAKNKSKVTTAPSKAKTSTTSKLAALSVRYETICCNTVATKKAIANKAPIPTVE